jgi:ribonuclease J
MEICTIGGFEEVGKNMTAVKVNDDVIIFDVGIYLPPLIELQEQENYVQYTEKMLRGIKAIPDDLILDKLGWRDKVRAIIIGHAHLDHVGGLPYLAQRYPKAEIIATSFTMQVLNSILEDEKIHLKNKKRIIKGDSKLKLKGASGDINLEFIHTTHSTLQCVLGTWHSTDGTFIYALDFKFDKHPIIGPPPNYRRLKELGKAKKVKCLVVDSLYSDTDRRTASERVARDLLEDVMSAIRNKNSAFFITTFSSHIARLKSIVEFGSKTRREIIFMGRSLNKYVTAAKNAGQCPFYNKIKLAKYRKHINSILSKVDKNRGKYLIVCTGHQGENGSILDRIANAETPFKFKQGDSLIFSSSIIPVTPNINARAKLDKKLRAQGVRLQKDVHVSGHAGREDLRDLVEMLQPKNIIPAHGSIQQLTPMLDLAKELGYQVGKECHLMQNGQKLKL